MQGKRCFILFLSAVFIMSFLLPAMAAKPKISTIEIQQTDNNIFIGETLQLTAKAYDKNGAEITAKISWKSSKKKIASISKTGLVTGISSGQTIITASASGKKDTLTINVSEDNTVSVTGVSLDKTTLTLTAGGAGEQLAASVLPSNATDKAITWASDAPAIATVNNGLVTPVTAGTANITVTTHAGGKQAICRVTVIAAQVPFTLGSNSFANGGIIPAKYAFNNGNTSVELHWSGLPEDTKSVAILMYDTHPLVASFVHWEVVNIPATVSSLPEGASGSSMPPGCRELGNDYGTTGYGGPYPPPDEVHGYKFIIYALNTSSVGLSGSVSAANFASQLAPYIIDSAEITSSYSY